MSLGKKDEIRELWDWKELTAPRKDSELQESDSFHCRKVSEKELFV